MDFYFINIFIFLILLPGFQYACGRPPDHLHPFHSHVLEIKSQFPDCDSQSSSSSSSSSLTSLSSSFSSSSFSSSSSSSSSSLSFSSSLSSSSSSSSFWPHRCGQSQHKVLRYSLRWRKICTKCSNLICSMCCISVECKDNQLFFCPPCYQDYWTIDAQEENVRLILSIFYFDFILF